MLTQQGNVIKYTQY